MEPTPPADDLYDPELHGDLESPPAARWLGFAIALALAALIVWAFGACC